MSLRNMDSSILTKLKGDRNQSAFYSAQLQRNRALTVPGVYYPSFNPQTGNYDGSKMPDINAGSYTTYSRAYGKTLVSVPCQCLPDNGLVANSIPAGFAPTLAPVSQPVGDNSPA